MNRRSKPWFFVGKPLRGPLHDGSTVLMATLLRELSRWRPMACLGDPQQPPASSDSVRVMRAPSMHHQPTMWQKSAVFGQLVRPETWAWPLHFFFTPNRTTSRIVDTIVRMGPKRPCVQTLMSSSDVESTVSRLRSLDRVIALSNKTQQRLIHAGLEPERVCCIYPGVVVPDTDVSDFVDSKGQSPATSRVREILYAGDLDANVVDRLLALAQVLREPKFKDWRIAVLSRPKSGSDAIERPRLQAGLSNCLEPSRYEIAGEIPNLMERFSRASLQIYAADHVDRKVDLPLAILEGLARGLPLLSCRGTPIDEIFERADEHGLSVGKSLPLAPWEFAERIRDVLEADARLETWSKDAPQLVRRCFCISNLAEKLHRLYLELESPPVWKKQKDPREHD